MFFLFEEHNFKRLLIVLNKFPDSSYPKVNISQRPELKYKIFLSKFVNLD